MPIFYSFCVNFPIAIRSFVASIIQSSLNRIYDNEIGVLSDEPKRQVDYSITFPTQSEYDAYNLIDAPLEKMLTPSKQPDESAWMPNAKLQEMSSVPPNIDWPTNEEFTPELGADKINLYIKDSCNILMRHLFRSRRDNFLMKSWDLTCGWVKRQSTCAMLSKRSARRTDKDLSPDICILNFRPGEHVFNEEWLKMVLEYKAKLGERLCF
ncbi:unnamed protein product [Hydatigera taeniaeformis]|uniref:Uncharacterized protein n=1 Tax=Hydatigena taeniaeformis TaxID=6205 RepID=A0A3P7GB65_HYDTA|nr:unnamed protein product [Hydatigera taeniaeformis]